ncbi:MAG: polysaccharide biosynthesis/export family protein [Pseudomonadota bacterium]
MIRLVLILLAVAVAVAGAAMAGDDYRLTAGDKLRLTVFEEPDLSGEFELDGAGGFSMPLIGPVDALGVTPRRLEQLVEARLLEGYLLRPRVSVEVLSYRPFYIMGEVNQPGSYPYRGGLTVLNAAALAGGFTYRADEDDIEISREADGGARFEAAPQTVIQPGDVIRVKERLF